MVDPDVSPPGDGPTHLQSIRRSAQLSQEDVAHRAGVSLRTLRNIELGAVSRPHRQTLRRLAAVLGLTDSECETFVGFWHPQPHSREIEVPDVLRPTVEDYLTPAQLRTKHEWTSLAKSSRDLFGPHRNLVSTETDDIVRADRDGARRATLLLHGDEGGGGGVRIVGTRHCAVVGETPVPEFKAKIFDIEFAVGLRVGDVYRWGVSIEYEPTESSAADVVGGIGFGIIRGGPSVTQEVSFDHEARPSQLQYAWFSHAMQGRELAREPLELNALGQAMFHLSAAPVGVHKIAWEW